MAEGALRATQRYCREDLEYVLECMTTRFRVSLRTHESTALLTHRGSGIESDGSSLFPLDSEDRVWKRIESALDNVQRM